MSIDIQYAVGTTVRLLVDLTRYHKILTKGAIGVISGNATQATFMTDYNSRFVKVRFGGVTIDVLRKNLEFIQS